MQITFYSIMMAFIWTTISVSIVFLLRRIRNRIFPVSLFIGLCLVSLARMCLPFELPYTKAVKAPLLYNWMYPYFEQNIPRIGISPWELILGGSAVISVLLMIRLACQYYVLHRRIELAYAKQDHIELELLKEQYPEFDDLEYLIISDKVGIPMQIGVCRPVVVLPDMQFQEKDLYYIIRHEMTHYKNRDTWVKLVINIWSCIFWWFPLKRLLMKELDESLELGCDRAVTKNMSNAQKADYLSSLLHVCEMQELKNKKTISRMAFQFYSSRESVLCRFHYVAEYHKNSASVVITTLILLALFAMSYLWVFQSYEQPALEPENDAAVYFSQEESCIVHTRDDRYELYINGEVLAEIDEETARNMLDTGIKCIEE